jgi:hypothetical protein
MKPPLVRSVRTSLQRQMARPGGLALEEAVARAEQGLEAQRDLALLALQAKVDALNDVCVRRDPDRAEEVYVIASALVDMAGFLEIPPFYSAAYSLCDAAHRMVAAQAWSWPQVEVHAHALSLILAGDCRGGEDIDLVLAGLRAMVEHTSVNDKTGQAEQQ